MVDEHFSRESMEKFYRSELSREEIRGIVRHLLAQCAECSAMAQAVARRENFKLLDGGAPSGRASDPHLYDQVFENVQRRVYETEARLARERVRARGKGLR